MKFFGIIPAKEKSSGLKNKNIKLFNKKPLIYWTIKAAKKSKKLKNFLITSDSNKILNISKKYKAKILHLRPKHLALPQTLMIDVVRYYYKYYQNYDAIVILQPTSPLRDSEDIDKACSIFERAGSDSLVAVKKLEHTSNPEQIFSLKKSQLKYLRNSPKQKFIRQKKKNYYVSNGSAVYITKIKNLSKFIIGGKISAYVMPKYKSIDIDDGDDFKAAEVLSKFKF
jgi:CMP-N,N'-diacetyllegionaminic acid synthase